MATWKLVSGILSIILTIVVLFQSCFAAMGGAVNEIFGAKESFAGTAGTLVALLMMSGGITSIATRNSETNGGNKALIGLFGLATLICLASMTGIYKDLIVWGIWCAINAGMAFKDMREKDGTAGRALTEGFKSVSKSALDKVSAATTGASGSSTAVTGGVKATANAETELTVCPSCGNKVNKKSKFCPKCGNVLSTVKTCPACGAELAAGAKFCVKCGNKLSNAENPVKDTADK